MKPIFYFAVLSILFLTNCKKSDPCESVTCFNGGVCHNGNCQCPDGFYGPNCELTTAGYNCINSYCVYVLFNAEYSAYSVCIDYCGSSSNTSGFSCFNNNCIFQTENGDFATLAECEANCANSGCSSIPYYGPQLCTSEEYVAVTPNSCCPKVYPYLGVQKNACYPTCWTALGDNNSTIIFGTGEE